MAAALHRPADFSLGAGQAVMVEEEVAAVEMVGAAEVVAEAARHHAWQEKVDGRPERISLSLHDTMVSLECCSIGLRRGPSTPRWVQHKVLKLFFIPL